MIQIIMFGISFYQQIWDLRIRMFDLFEGSLHIVGRIMFDLGPKI